MWFFRKTTLESSGVFDGFTDFHSHILPGVDDGFRKMEDSLAALEFVKGLGFKTLWCTPHVMEDIPNTTSSLKKRFAELQASYDGPLELHLAAEYMLDDLFEERLSTGDFLYLGDSQILVETSYFNPPVNMDELLRKIMASGIYPVLAHPERYVYMDEKDYLRLHGMGVRFQLNLTSFGGAYGPVARKKAEWLYKKGMVFCYGSDMHSLPHFKMRIKNKISVKFENNEN